MASAFPFGAANGEASKDEKPSSTTNGKAPAAGDQHIRIRVITSDMTNEVHFRLRKEVPMIRMKRAYAEKLGHNLNELRYVFDGRRITDTDTPKSLGMVNDDVVEIYQERTGGGM
ncbi:small ubiquitin-related modifier-like [Acyrthosiphon pisum]|uniref:Ubiquitin-like domain-containing protein n=1 Tax=Acyrthosiphon pisum TaxID=7029 RepID=A0A8R1W5Z8_ACYPI|nr:small ubiquitin-related modifier-like [Acyrthosiphon pisum]XP_008183360.1 small ubiquitin-related modifier-like [Acyrthosiphon pisum]|eukprot:XP_003244725.1 PREDICTED: small ubiquitin-related modifier-like [Acyrthosiphon pisum]